MQEDEPLRDFTRLYDSADSPYLRSMKIFASIRLSLICAFALTLICAAVASAQTAPASSSATDVLLVVGGEVEHPLKLTPGDLSKFKRQSVRAKDHNGVEGKFDGVALGDILKAAVVKFGEQLAWLPFTIPGSEICPTSRWPCFTSLIFQISTEGERVRIGNIGGSGGATPAYKHSHLEFYRGNAGLPALSARPRLRIDPATVFGPQSSESAKATIGTN
jgi:hypothetical protein